MKFDLKLFALTLAGLVAGAAQSLPAQDLLLNGSFEDQGGSFNRWNVNSPDGSLIIDSPGGNYINAFVNTADDGNYYALFTPGTSPSTLDQAFNTTVGATYDINFWVNNPHGDSSLLVTAGSSTLLNLSASDSELNGLGWVDFNYNYQATGTTADLSFAATSGGFLGLDAVSVAAVPEPGTWFFGFAALGVVVMGSRRARQKR